MGRYLGWVLYDPKHSTPNPRRQGPYMKLIKANKGKSNKRKVTREEKRKRQKELNKPKGKKEQECREPLPEPQFHPEIDPLPEIQNEVLETVPEKGN
jgi:hypothetical protein